MNIAGSVVLVTGANRGLGESFVRALLDRGAAKVYAGARDVASVTVEGAVPVRLDIDDAAKVAATAEQLSDVTLVINNAGISTGASLLTADVADIRREFETNFFGTLNVTRAFAPVLAANGGGALVNVLSVLSWISFPATGAYCASKAASLSLTNSVRAELHGQKTQVLALHVGYMDTDMTAGVDAPKSDPTVVAAAALDGLEAGQSEVLADEISVTVRSALSGPLSALYPSAASATDAVPGSPRLEPTSLEGSGSFVAAAGLVVDSVSSDELLGHIDIGESHHTPWGIVHGGVYSTAIESAASIPASRSVQDQGMVAVGLTNTTHFLRLITSGRADVVARPLNQGRTQQLWQVDVRDGRGRLLAHGEVRLQNVSAD